MNALTLNRRTPLQATLGMVLLSLMFHISFLFQISSWERPEYREPVKMKVSVRAKPKPKPIPSTVVPKKRPPPPPKPKTVRKAKPKAKQKAMPVLGLSKNSFTKSENATTIVAPAGNTAMAKDKGIRLKPEEVAALGKDLSSPAVLIRSSIKKVEKTDDALDAGLIGRFRVDVYVASDGIVTSVDLEKKVGYGMDTRLLAAAKKARFKPRLNVKGKPVPGWTQITFRLTED